MIKILDNFFYITEGFTNLLVSLFNGMHYKGKKRLAVCRSCPHKNGSRCGICGCFLKAKVLVKYPLDENGFSIGGCPNDPPKW